MTENTDTTETETESESESEPGQTEQHQTSEDERTPAQAAPSDTMNVDLSPDDETPQDGAQRPHEERERHVATETAAGGAGGGQEPAQAREQEQEEYDAAGEAKRLIKNSDGDTPDARSKNAIEQVQQHLKQISQRLQQVRQRESKTEERIEDLQEARVHVRRAPDDLPIFRSFGGGITVGVAPTDEYGTPEEDERVPAEDAGTDDHADVPEEGGIEPGDGVAEFSGVYDRDDLIRDIDDTLESEQQTLAGLREEQGKLSRGIGNAEDILRELQDYREKSQWLTQEDTQGSPAPQNADPNPPVSHGGGTVEVAETQRQTRTGGQPAQQQPPSQPQQRRTQGGNAAGHVDQTREATPQELAEQRQRGAPRSAGDEATGPDPDHDRDRDRDSGRGEQ